MKFADIKITAKLFGLTSLIGLLFTSVIWYFDVTMRTVSSGYDQALMVGENIEYAHGAIFHMLQARRREKDFFLRFDAKYVDAVDEQVAEAIAEAEAMRSALNEAHLVLGRDKTGQLITQVQHYQTAFNKAVDAARQKGLDYQSGLQGNLRDIAHDMEMEIQKGQAQQSVDAMLNIYLEMRRNEKDYLLRSEEKKTYFDKLKESIKTFEQSIAASEQPPQVQNTLFRHLEHYQTLFHSIFRQDEIIDIQTETMRNAVHRAEKLAIEIRNNIRDNAQQIITVTKRDENLARDILHAVILATILFGALLSYILVRIITRPLIHLSQTMEEVSKSGDFSRRVKISGHDEVGLVEDAFNRMAERTEQQDWLKAGAATLARIVQNAKNPQDFSQSLIGELVTLTNAGYGAIFYRREDAEHYSLLASSGFSALLKTATDTDIGTAFVANEGLAGRCAMEKKTILLTGAPKEFIKIRSNLGEAPPHTIIALPLVFQEKVLGVIEMASFKPFTPLQQTLLDELSPAIALSLENLMRTTSHIQTLLEETQAQNEELQLQQEELQQSNERLNQRTQALQISEEELKQQQEELLTSNLLLSERTEELESNQTELEKAQQETERKATDLERASRYKSEFLANMSHELRTPLNSLLILAKLFADNEDGNLSGEQIESARIIHRNGFDLLYLINDILDLSKIESGKMETNVTTVIIGPFANDLHRHFEHVAQDKALGWRVEVAEGVPAKIYTDSSKLLQILNNFLANAFKFTKKGEVTLHFHRLPKDRRLPDDVLRIVGNDSIVEKKIAITVTDTGIGIAKEKQQAIFEAFQQADGGTSRQYGGTGLGLSIARNMAQLLGCEIQLRSIEGKGSAFTLLLPIKAEIGDNQILMPIIAFGRRKTDADPFILDDQNIITAKDKTFLVIENDPRLASLACTLFHQKGLKSLAAADGASGLTLATRYQPSGILFGDTVPDMDISTLRTKLKEHPETRQIPVHAITAMEEELNALSNAAVSVLTKPVSKTQLKMAVKVLKCFLGKDAVRNMLLLEDDPVARKAIVDLFTHENYHITQAASGEEAFQLLQQHSFDCMILDLGLPGMSGLDLLDKIAAEKSMIQPPIIVYTGRDLSIEDYQRLRQYTDSIVLKGKGSHSAQRLMDEMAGFLETTIPKLSLSTTDQTPIDGKTDKIFQNEKILIADDDMRNTFALVRALKMRGLNVVAAPDGKRALELLEQNPDVRCILMDIMMPELDGYETMHAIRQHKRFKKLPIIALTAKAMAEDREKCLEAGADDFLSKPVEMARLFDVIKNLLNRNDAGEDQA